MESHHLFSWLHSDFNQYFWLIQYAIIIAITLLCNFAIDLIHNHITLKLKSTKNIWGEALLFSLHKPLKFFVLLLGILYSYQILSNTYPKIIPLSIVEPLRTTGVVFSFIWFLMRLVKEVELRLAQKEIQHLDKTTLDAFSKLIRLTLVAVGILVLLQEAGISLSVVLAFGGGGALVVGLAAKDILANFFGGLMIYLDRPFSVGEWIASPDKEIEGTVEYIGWRLTRIRTFDKRPLFVPNSLFSTLAIKNPSRMTNRRIKTVFGVRYCDAPKITAIVADIEEMLQNHPEIDTRQTLFVKLIEFGESSLNILIYTFTKTTRWVKFQSIQQDVFLKVIDIVYNKHKASMPFPTRTLDIPDQRVDSKYAFITPEGEHDVR